MDIEFAAGETSKMVEIPIIDDDQSESLEMFFLALSSSPSSPNFVTVSPISRAVVTIMDDDGKTQYHLDTAVAGDQPLSLFSCVFIQRLGLESLLAVLLVIPISY